MEWLFKPKVQLGLFLNFIFVMFTLVTSTAGGNAHTGYLPLPSSSAPEKFVPPPPAEMPKVASYYFDSTGDLNVYLDNDMSLVRRPRFVLLLSPLCSVNGNEEKPRSVLLRFTSFSSAQIFDYNDSLTIRADGAQIWPAYRRDGSPVWEGWNDKPVPPSHSFYGNESVVETIGVEIPYAVFVKTVTAKRVNFKLGPESTDLTDEQLRVLRDMYRRLSQSPMDAR